MFAEWTDWVLIYYSSKNNIFEKESLNPGYPWRERAIEEISQSEDFDGGLQWLPVDSSPSQALSVALDHLSLIWMAQISDEGQQSEKQGWLHFLFTVLCPEYRWCAGYRLCGKTCLIPNNLKQWWNWGDAKDSDMGQGGGNMLIAPTALGGAGVGMLYTEWPPGRNFSIPHPH